MDIASRGVVFLLHRAGESGEAVRLLVQRGVLPVAPVGQT